MRWKLGRAFCWVASVAALVAGMRTRARAVFVVTSNAYATTAGPLFQQAIFGNGSSSSDTFQVDYAASQFASVPIGTPLTSIGFRLNAGMSTDASALVFSQFDVQIGRSATTLGALQSSFAANQGADTLTARSGALTIAPGSFVGGAGPNPFCDIVLSNAYTYTGGDLLITIRDAFVSSTNIPTVDVDAVAPVGVTDTDVNFSNTSTSGGTEFFNAPITRFGFTSAAVVPEPSSLALGAMASLAGLGVWARRQLHG